MNRTISAEEFIAIANSAIRDSIVVLDVRRKDDFDSSDLLVSGAEWKDPTLINQWVGSVPQDKDVVIYCVRGGGVSNSVVDRLITEGRHASFIEGGIVALDDTHDVLVNKTFLADRCYQLAKTSKIYSHHYD